MHQRPKIVAMSDVDVGRHPEHRQVTEPRRAIRLDVALPTNRLASLHREPERMVGDGPLGLSAPEVRHVEARAEVTRKRITRTGQRCGMVEDQPVLTVVAPQAILDQVRVTPLEGPGVSVPAALQICAVDDSGATIA